MMDELVILQDKDIKFVEHAWLFFEEDINPIHNRLVREIGQEGLVHL
jgi:hypothetical protein